MAAAFRSERRSMERFDSGGMALLPWTRHVLTALWEQLRLLLQVIYYSFLSVFQLFRFEVHVRITDETGEHIRHVTNSTDPTESILFSSLFEGDDGVIVGNSKPLSSICADVGDPFAGKSTAGALLSSLRADDLCCGLVDDFVSRTSNKEENLFRGHQASWKMGLPGELKLFMSSSDSSSEGPSQNNKKVLIRDVKKNKHKQESSEEERTFQWSSEEDQNAVEFDCKESKALWESFSSSTDPYNPYFFSARTTTTTTKELGKSKSKTRHTCDSEVRSINIPAEENLGSRNNNLWVSHSDSERSWPSSGSSSPDVNREENDRLWDFFSGTEDPYNPMCFTAATVGRAGTTVARQRPFLPALLSNQDSDSEERRSSSFPPSSADDEEDQLWRSLCKKDDPYHPLNFRARLLSSPAVPALRHAGEPPCEPPKKLLAVKPRVAERRWKQHSHSENTFLPWRRPAPRAPPPPPERKQDNTTSVQKKVHFSPVVHVHVMRTWRFARQECRKGPWEEMARDRDRFQRRIQETEKSIGYCLAPPHREEVRARLEDGALK